MEFKQSAFLKPYIDYNTELLKQAEESNKIKKQSIKLRNNTIFGKSVENPMNTFNVKVLSDYRKYLKWSNKPAFRREKQLPNWLIVIRKNKWLNKPTHIGKSILELSKVLVYDFHYNYIKNKYDNKAELLLTYADSLIKEIETENLYEDLCKDKELFYFSNYWKKSNYYYNTNSSIFGKMKNETCDVPMKDFVELKAKLYAYRAIARIPANIQTGELCNNS